MSKSEELNNWAHALKCQKAVEALKKNGFTAVYCHDSAEAFHYILNEAAEADNVGFGGSLSIAELRLTEKLKAMGKEILDHAAAGTPEEKQVVMRRQLTSDLFLTGTNAVTISGKLVNVDATGNRVGSMLYGPKKVIVVAGRNKVVNGGVDEALERIRTFAGPANSKRLNLQTPCAVTGFCSDCDSPQRICRITTVLEKKPRTTDIRVLVVNEDMGL